MPNCRGKHGNNYIPSDMRKEYGRNVYQEVIYDEPEDDELNINHIGGEIEVDSRQEEWMIPMGEPSTSRPTNPPQKIAPTPAIVLKTVDDLKVRPRLHVNCGKRPVKVSDERPDPDDLVEEYPEEDDPNEPSTSGIPTIRPALRMYASAAIRNAGNVRLMDFDGEMVNIDEDAKEEIPRVGKRGQLIFNHKNWPLYNDQPIGYQEACEILCGALEIDKKLICTSIPQSFKNEGTFIIDLRMMRNRHEVHQDGLGSWARPTGRVRYYSKVKDGSNNIERADDGKGKLPRGAKYVWKCMLKRYEHPVTSAINDGANRFIKKIYTALYPAEINKAVGLAIVSYEWIGREPFDFPVTNITRNINRRPHSSIAPNGSSWEASSFHSRHHGALPATMSGFFRDIPIYAVGAIDFNSAALVILGGALVDPNKIAHSVPQGYREAGTFVIDTEFLAAEGLLRRDNNGIWGKPAGTSRYYIIDAQSGDAVRIDNNNKLPPGVVHDIQILCKRYEHPSVDRRFVRKIYTVKTTGLTPLPHRLTLAVISYFWKGEPAPLEIKRQNSVLAAHEYLDEDYTERFSERIESPPKRMRVDSEQNEGDEEDNSEFRRALWKKEYENQVRFSSILDRAEAFITRLERATENSTLYNPQANGESHQWNQGERAEEPPSETNEEEFQA